jgi:hypothetical protein
MINFIVKFLLKKKSKKSVILKIIFRNFEYSKFLI